MRRTAWLPYSLVALRLRPGAMLCLALRNSKREPSRAARRSLLYNRHRLPSLDGTNCSTDRANCNWQNVMIWPRGLTVSVASCTAARS